MQDEPEDTCVLAIGNLKGGVGKSTLTVGIACALAAAGWPTIVLDTDPQATSTRWGSKQLLPAEVVSAPIRDFRDASDWVTQVNRLRDSAAFVLIDLPAVLTTALAAAAMVADGLLVPAIVSEIDLVSLQRTLHYLGVARRERGDGLPGALIVPTRIDKPGMLLRRQVDFGRLPDLGERLAPPLFHDRLHREAFAAGRWVGDLEPGGSAHRDLLAIMDATTSLLRARRPLPAKSTAMRGEGRDVSAALAYLQRRGERRTTGSGLFSRAGRMVGSSS